MNFQSRILFGNKLYSVGNTGTNINFHNDTLLTNTVYNRKGKREKTGEIKKKRFLSS